MKRLEITIVARAEHDLIEAYNVAIVTAVMMFGAPESADLIRLTHRLERRRDELLRPFACALADAILRSLGGDT